MTQEVLAHGDDGSVGGGRPGRAVGVAVTAALLAVVGVAVARSQSGREPRARPSPSPSMTEGWTGYPIDGGAAIQAAPEFEEYVTVRRPPPGVLRAVLLPGGKPGFLVPAQDPADEPTAVSAFGGPAHAQVVVGWCARTSTFQDQDGAYVYDRSGGSLRGGGGLDSHHVRRNARDRLRLDVDATPIPAPPRPGATTPPPQCPDRLYLPTLPGRARGVHDTLKGHRVLRGRYVVTTQSRAFCALDADAACQAQGWERYGEGLPPQDLAGSYTWEGDFVVRGGTDGRLSVGRLPEARLVRRARVGARAVLVAPLDVTGSRTLRLRVAGEDSDQTYVLRSDCEVFLGKGVTGLGRPRGTGETLREFLLASSQLVHDSLWLVLDGRGRVLRVVADR